VHIRPAGSANDTTHVYVHLFIRKFIELVSSILGGLLWWLYSGCAKNWGHSAFIRTSRKLSKILLWLLHTVCTKYVYVVRVYSVYYWKWRHLHTATLHRENAYFTVAALAIDKVGTRPYYFRSGPTSGPTTLPGNQKSKISVVHGLAVLKGHLEYLRWEKPFGGCWGSLQRSADPVGGGERAGCPLHNNRTPALGPSGLQPWPFGPRSLPPQIRLPKSAM